METQEKHDDSRDKEHGHALVTVTVDTKAEQVKPGGYTVSAFKSVVGVDPARELEEIVHGKLTPLDDNAKIHIKGGEVFMSHVRSGGSS